MPSHATKPQDGPATGVEAALPQAAIDVWLFDLDNTLYPAACRLFDQVEKRMAEFICGFLSVSEAEAHALRHAYWRSHGTTLSGLMSEHGLDPRPFLDYVHDIDVSVIEADRKLDAALADLPGRRLVFTNGSVAHAERILERLGIAGRFEAIFGIEEAAFICKPDPEAYRRLIAAHAIEPARTLFVEDTAKNLPPAARAGMTTLWLEHAFSRPPDAETEPHIHHRTSDLAAWLENAVQTAARR